MRPEEIQERLKSAAKSLQAVQLPEHLEVVAFERLLDVYGLPAPEQGGPADSSQPAIANHPAHSDKVRDGHDPLAVIAQKLGSDLRSVSQIYDVQDGSVQLIVRRDMLPEPTKKAVSMRQVGLLVAAGRQAAGIEEWTPMATLRDECREIGVLDSTNFSTEIGKLVFKVKGTGVKREVRATRHHLSEASDLLNEFVKDAGP